MAKIWRSNKAIFHGRDHRWCHAMAGMKARSVSIFWDLDNKPPLSVAPYEAALRLRQLAEGFGSVVDMVAYANRHAFIFVPGWVREQRKQRKVQDLLEIRGVLVPDHPYRCDYCGCKCKTHLALIKHFKQLHERERNKRLSRLDSLAGKRKIKYKERLAVTERKYLEAARDIITPKVGYGLWQELKKAGVWVQTVADKPQAADRALKEHMLRSITNGISCICLVSDDSDFSKILQHAQSRQLHTVVVGDTSVLQRYADMRFSWADVSSGRALTKATEAADFWYGDQDLVRHPVENNWLRILQQSSRGEFGARKVNSVHSDELQVSSLLDNYCGSEKSERQVLNSSDDELGIWWSTDEEDP